MIFLCGFFATAGILAITQETGKIAHTPRVRTEGDNAIPWTNEGRVVGGKALTVLAGGKKIYYRRAGKRGGKVSGVCSRPGLQQRVLLSAVVAARGYASVSSIRPGRTWIEPNISPIDIERRQFHKIPREKCATRRAQEWHHTDRAPHGMSGSREIRHRRPGHSPTTDPDGTTTYNFSLRQRPRTRSLGGSQFWFDRP